MVVTETQEIRDDACSKLEPRFQRNRSALEIRVDVAMADRLKHRPGAFIITSRCVSLIHSHSCLPARQYSAAPAHQTFSRAVYPNATPRQSGSTVCQRSPNDCPALGTNIQGKHRLGQSECRICRQRLLPKSYSRSNQSESTIPRPYILPWESSVSSPCMSTRSCYRGPVVMGQAAAGM